MKVDITINHSLPTCNLRRLLMGTFCMIEATGEVIQLVSLSPNDCICVQPWSGGNGEYDGFKILDAQTQVVPLQATGLQLRIASEYGVGRV